MNQILFLGTGGSRFVVFKQIRASGGIWISFEGTNLLIDPGPGSLIRILNSKRLKQAKLNNPEKLDGILLSHRHLDHCADINVIIEAMTLTEEFKKDENKKKRRRVFVPSDALNNDPIIYKFILKKFVDIVTLQKNSHYNIGEISFETTEYLKHPVQTFGFNFKLGNNSISFISDTRVYDELPLQFNGNIVIVNVGRLKHSEKFEADQLTVDEAIDILKAIKPNEAILTHFGMTTIKRNKPWEVVDELEKLIKTVDFKLITAYDGYAHEIDNLEKQQIRFDL